MSTVSAYLVTSFCSSLAAAAGSGSSSKLRNINIDALLLLFLIVLVEVVHGSTAGRPFELLKTLRLLLIAPMLHYVILYLLLAVVHKLVGKRRTGEPVVVPSAHPIGYPETPLGNEECILARSGQLTNLVSASDDLDLRPGFIIFEVLLLFFS